jgi:ABC-type lipoprotein release transport system permease subunit
VARIVVVRGVALAAVGASAGFLLVLVLVRSLRADFPDLTAHAAGWNLAVVAAVVCAVALGASWLPAARAARIAPALALRAE